MFHTRAYNGRFGNGQRNRLTLHVRSHERAVGVVVFKERNQRCGDRYNLLRRHVHEVNLFACHLNDFFLAARHNAGTRKVAVFADGLIGLRNHVFIFFIRRQVDNLFRHDVVFLINPAVRRFNKAILVNTRVCRERADKANVWTFWRLDRAHTAIVRMVNVTHIERCALTVQPAGAQCRQTPLMRQLCERIRLIHKLREL